MLNLLLDLTGIPINIGEQILNSSESGECYCLCILLHKGGLFIAVERPSCWLTGLHSTGVVAHATTMLTGMSKLYSSM